MTEDKGTENGGSKHWWSIMKDNKFLRFEKGPLRKAGEEPSQGGEYDGKNGGYENDKGARAEWDEKR